MTVLNSIENAMSCEAKLRTTLKIDDPVQCSKMLADAADLIALQKVLSADIDILLELQNVLKPLTRTAVDGHIMGMDGKVHERFFELDQVNLPVFDPAIHSVPLHSYRFKCGLDILCFALRYVTKAGKFNGRMNPWTDQQEGLVQMQFEMSRTNNLPKVEQSEMSEAEKMRRLALGYPLEASKSIGGNVKVIPYLLNLEMQCYQDPENEEIMMAHISRVRTKADTFQNSSDLQEIVETVIHETCLAAFLV